MWETFTQRLFQRMPPLVETRRISKCSGYVIGPEPWDVEPIGWGRLTNPRKAAYNRVYNRTTVGCSVLLTCLLGSWVAQVS
jgi:hypothetical protein